MPLRPVPNVPDDTPDEQHFTVKEAAHFLRCDPKTVRNLAYGGRIAYLDMTPDDGRERERRNIRISAGALRKYIKDHTIDARVSA